MKTSGNAPTLIYGDKLKKHYNCTLNSHVTLGLVIPANILGRSGSRFWFLECQTVNALVFPSSIAPVYALHYPDKKRAHSGLI